jgi:hypothetical protein
MVFSRNLGCFFFAAAAQPAFFTRRCAKLSSWFIADGCSFSCGGGGTHVRKTTRQLICARTFVHYQKRRFTLRKLLLRSTLSTTSSPLTVQATDTNHVFERRRSCRQGKGKGRCSSAGSIGCGAGSVGGGTCRCSCSCVDASCRRRCGSGDWQESLCATRMVCQLGKEASRVHIHGLSWRPWSHGQVPGEGAALGKVHVPPGQVLHAASERGHVLCQSRTCRDCWRCCEVRTCMLTSNARADRTGVVTIIGTLTLTAECECMLRIWSAVQNWAGEQMLACATSGWDACRFGTQSLTGSMLRVCGVETHALPIVGRSASWSHEFGVGWFEPFPQWRTHARLNTRS